VSAHADLTSVLSTLDQMMERLEDVAASVDGEAKEDLLVDLYEVERHLRAASRRLTRTVSGLADTAGR
jgi:hypothetical protein